MLSVVYDPDRQPPEYLPGKAPPVLKEAHCGCGVSAVLNTQGVRRMWGHWVRTGVADHYGRDAVAHALGFDLDGGVP